MTARTSWKLPAVLLALVAGVGVVGWVLHSMDTSVSTAAAAPPESTKREIPREEPASPKLQAAREEIVGEPSDTVESAAGEPAPEETEFEAKPLHVEGIVTDLRGFGVPAVPIVVQGLRPVIARSAADGTFRCEVDREGR